MFILSAAHASSSRGGSGTAWLVVVAALVTGVLGLAGVLFTVWTQRRIEKDKRSDDKQREIDQATAVQIASQVDLTKDVLENWKDIVRTLGDQLTQLHAQVLSLEDRERKCQGELMKMRSHLLEVEENFLKKPRKDTDFGLD